jgi:Domain of unknown function (DUF4276)
MSWPIVQVSCVVEGHGEREAVPALIRRIGHAHQVVAKVSQPIRVSRSRLVKKDELEKAVTLAAMRLTGAGGVLVLADADDDCPAELGPKMQAWGAQARSDLPVAVVLAKVEFEAWFLAAATSIAGHRGLCDPLTPPPEPEGVHDAKGWLSWHMLGGRRYSETLDQAPLAAVFDLDLARRADSFDKFHREIRRLLSVAPTIAP